MRQRRDYNRYSVLKKDDGDFELMPFIKIPESPSDKYESWRKGISRLDKLSQKYYGSPFYDFFILLANPKFINEWEIFDDEIIRIPFPLDRVKTEYEDQIKKYINM